VTLEQGPQVVEYNLQVPVGEVDFEGRTSRIKDSLMHDLPLVVWVSRDITEKVQAEQRQKDLEKELVQAHKMEAVSVTAGGVDHDLNNLPPGASKQTIEAEIAEKQMADSEMSLTSNDGAKILVVDDFEDQRQVLKDALELSGHKVSMAQSGGVALETIKRQPFDLVFLDMKMGDGMDGIETFEKMKEVKPSLKTVILTGQSESTRLKQALAEGG
jgi:CheY-like chemotaxis protein